MSSRKILAALQVKIIFWLSILFFCIVAGSYFLRSENAEVAKRSLDASMPSAGDVIGLAGKAINSVAAKAGQAEILIKEGQAALLFGDTATAKARFTSAIQSNPSFAEGYFYLAAAYARDGQSAMSVENLRKAISLDRKFAQLARERYEFDPIRQDTIFQSLVR